MKRHFWWLAPLAGVLAIIVWNRAERIACAQTRAATATSQPAGLVRTAIRIDLYDFADANGIIDGAAIQAAIKGYTSVHINLPTCDEIENANGTRRPAAPILRNGLRIAYADGFRRFSMSGDSNRPALGVVGPAGLVFEGVPPHISGVRLQGLDWGQGPPTVLVELKRDPATDGSCNGPIIENAALELEAEKAGVALKNSGQEKMVCRDSLFRSDNGVGILLDTDGTGPRSTMSGWVIWNCDIQTYGVGVPIRCRGVVTNGLIGGMTWIGTASQRPTGDRRPLQRDAIQVMIGQNKPVSAGIPRQISVDIVPEGAAKKVAQWGISVTGVQLVGDSYAMGVRELFLTDSVPGGATP